MTEEEKMLSGELYKPMDKELTLKRARAKDLCDEFNRLPSKDRVGQFKVLCELFGKRVVDVTIESNFFCDYGTNISIDEGFYANHNLVILDAGKVTIGKNVFMGPNCGIYTSIHPIDKDVRKTGVESAKPITIKDDVWIGGNVVILPGVTVGSNVVIGAGSVVTKDVPDNTVVAGNPAKVIREIKKDA